MSARGMLGRLFKTVLKSPLERQREDVRRLRELSGVIDEAPADLTHYVLRGELNLDRGEHALAMADFERALELAEKFDESKGWLVLEQVMRDRALYGLKTARGALRQRPSLRPVANVEA